MAPERLSGRSAGAGADEVAATAERAARHSYGRLVALLAASTGDLALAEDALAEAFAQALTSWPAAGQPFCTSSMTYHWVPDSRPAMP